jgi:hypothetical protein
MDELKEGLACIKHGSDMLTPVDDKDEGWDEWLREHGLWDETKCIDDLYLRYRCFKDI